MIKSEGEGIRKEIKKKQKPSIKHSLDSFIYSWPHIEEKKENMILDKLLESIAGKSLRDSNKLSKLKASQSPIQEKDVGFLVGLNKVTANIHDLEAVFVCKNDCKPLSIIYHLPLMCKSNTIRLITLPINSSAKLSQSLGVKRVTVVGFKVFRF